MVSLGSHPKATAFGRKDSWKKASSSEHLLISNPISAIHRAREKCTEQHTDKVVYLSCWRGIYSLSEWWWCWTSSRQRSKWGIKLWCVMCRSLLIRWRPFKIERESENRIKRRKGLNLEQVELPPSLSASVQEVIKVYKVVSDILWLCSLQRYKIPPTLFSSDIRIVVSLARCLLQRYWFLIKISMTM